MGLSTDIDLKPVDNNECCKIDKKFFVSCTYNGYFSKYDCWKKEIQLVYAKSTVPFQTQCSLEAWEEEEEKKKAYKDDLWFKIKGHIEIAVVQMTNILIGNRFRFFHLFASSA